MWLYLKNTTYKVNIVTVEYSTKSCHATTLSDICWLTLTLMGSLVNMALIKLPSRPNMLFFILWAFMISTLFYSRSKTCNAKYYQYEINTGIGRRMYAFNAQNKTLLSIQKRRAGHTRLLSFTLRMPKYSVFYQLLEGEGLLGCVYFFISNSRFGYTSRLYSSAIIYELAVDRLLDIDK